MTTSLIGVKAGVVEMAAPQAARHTPANDDGDGDEGDDATAAKQRTNSTEVVSHGPNDEDDDAVQRENERDTMASEAEDEGINGGSPPEVQDPADGEDGKDDDDMRDWLAKARVERVMSAYAPVTDFQIDERDGCWCNVTLEFDFFFPNMLMLNIVQAAVRITVYSRLRASNRAALLTTERANVWWYRKALTCRRCRNVTVSSTRAVSRQMKLRRSWIFTEWKLAEATLCLNRWESWALTASR